jgi:hypothetical protein
MWNDSELREEGIKFLQQLSEQQLKDEIIKPLFGEQWSVGFDRWEKHTKEWSVFDVDRKSELEHRCDLVLSSVPHRGELLIGIQLKAWNNRKNDIPAGKYVVTKIRPCAEAALRDRYRNGVRLAKYYWITTGHISEPNGRKAIERFIDAPETTGGRVEVWDVNILYDKFVNAQTLRNNLDETASDVVTGLRINAIRRQIDQHMQKEEGVFAALISYAALRACLLRQIPDVPIALACATVGLAALSQDPILNIYYYRVLRNVLETWEALLRARPEVWQRNFKSLEGAVARDDVRGVLREKFEDGDDRLEFILDFDFIFGQLRQLERYYVNGPSGLSTLQLSRLLLRSGFGPTDRELKERLKRVQNDLEKEEGKSIDGRCSLCTGAIVSCFALARNRGLGIKAIEWLSSLAPYSYCYRESGGMDSCNHALHYTAAVLQAFIDLDPGCLDLSMGGAVDVFFGDAELNALGVVRNWMRHRNESSFNIYHDILSAFLRFHLMGRGLGESRTMQLRESIRMLVSALEEDCREVQIPWKLYAARENLSSFCLGLILEVGESYEFARQIARLFRHRARKIVKDAADSLLDSNIDITMAFLEGYLDYWETLFYLQERGRPIAHLLPALGPPVGIPIFEARTPVFE